MGGEGEGDSPYLREVGVSAKVSIFDCNWFITWNLTRICPGKLGCSLKLATWCTAKLITVFVVELLA